MNNWRIINKFAIAFGIIFIVFTALAAVLSYELDKVLYLAAAPTSLIDYSFITAMLPFLLGAVLSFTVYALTLQTTKTETEKETEAQPTVTQQTETQPAPEDVFNETP